MSVKLLIILSMVFSSVNIYSSVSNTLSQQDCSKKLVDLIDTKASNAQVVQLYKDCAQHGSSEQQLVNAREVAVLHNKSGVAATINQALNEKRENKKSNNAWEIIKRVGKYSTYIIALFTALVLGEQVVEEAYKQLIDTPEQEKEIQEQAKKISKNKKILVGGGTA